MAEDWAGLAWLAVLLLGNAFFVGAEFAVVTARRSQIEPIAERGSRAAQTALYAMEHATLMLATSQLGITVCSLVILNVSEPALHHLLSGPLALTGLPAAAIPAAAFVIALLTVSYLHVVLGEMVPKNLSFSLPERAVLVLAPPLVFCSRLFGPVISALNGLANLALRLCRIEPKAETTSAYTFDEVAEIVERSKREGVLLDASGALTNAFEFTRKRVREVALPIGRVIALPRDATPQDVERAVGRSGFSRYLVTGPDGEPAGYVHLKDILDLSGEAALRPIPAERVRGLGSCPEETELEDALAGMRRGGHHLVRVFDRTGRTSGLLFLEDIIEELVGEIRDATARHGSRQRP